MGDHPILFSAPMIRANLAGIKTQTRRVSKPQPEERFWEIFKRWPNQHHIVRWKPGDRLWVREAHQIDADGALPNWTAYGVIYKADGVSLELPEPIQYEGKCTLGLSWVSGRFMFRWASRMTLLVKTVRVERVQDITQTDAMAEGLTFDPLGGWSGNTTDNNLWMPAPELAYASLWNTIHKRDGPNGWDANPWVSVTEYSVVTRNIDRIGKEPPA